MSLYLPLSLFPTENKKNHERHWIKSSRSDKPQCRNTWWPVASASMHGGSPSRRRQPRDQGPAGNRMEMSEARAAAAAWSPAISWLSYSGRKPREAASHCDLALLHPEKIVQTYLEVQAGSLSSRHGLGRQHAMTHAWTGAVRMRRMGMVLASPCQQGVRRKNNVSSYFWLDAEDVICIVTVSEGTVCYRMQGT